ncbi:Protein of unknwon function [Ectopseudomonas chengduensis]|uniref:Protein of unknwon function n=1 Tax=Ectopseudomonas chengduensis TaxID=489632 RepID=A0A1G6NYL5_9GAMM|nr:DUF3310 domain-containing protein [Pseudomonas chengduensis]SDC73120.1 Protein of unknwon function [Pseudomonas chengduensis]
MTYALTPMSARAIGVLLNAGGGSDAILLRRPERELRAELHIERCGRTLTATILLGHQRSSLTLQDGDGANQLNLAEQIEAIANGTADTAETGAIGTPATLKTCCKCGGEAIGYDYAIPGTEYRHGVKCRHGDCQAAEGATTADEAHAAWNRIQAEKLDEPTAHPADMVNHPPHYNGHPSGLECIEVTELLPFNLGNAFKYVFRHRSKNGREDLEKARWYLNRELERCERGGISIGYLQATHALAGRIAAHEPYPVGAALVAIAADEPAEALHWIEHLLAA